VNCGSIYLKNYKAPFGGCGWAAASPKRGSTRRRLPNNLAGVFVEHRLGDVARLLELCPRGNNKDVIIIILVYDNVYIPC
jgi:hypothetical protein